MIFRYTKEKEKKCHKSVCKSNKNHAANLET